MRLAFSTLGVPSLPVPDVVALATAHRFHGVELRVHPEEPVHPGLEPAARERVVEEFARAGVEIVGLAGYVRIAEPGDDTPVLAELRALLELARDLGAPYVRVFPGGGDAPTEECDATAVRRLGEVRGYAADLAVRVLLETHDSHPTGADVVRVLERVNHRSVGALWDVLHTWRGGEQPETSQLVLAPYLGYVQVKDVASVEDTTPLPPGAGVLPLNGVVDALSRTGWEGWLCWEYEKRWYPQVPALPDLIGGVREKLMRLVDEAA